MPRVKAAPRGDAASVGMQADTGCQPEHGRPPIPWTAPHRSLSAAEVGGPPTGRGGPQAIMLPVALCNTKGSPGPSISSDHLLINGGLLDENMRVGQAATCRSRASYGHQPSWLQGNMCRTWDAPEQAS